MQTLTFTQNWNGKLFLDNFGTVRLHNEQKYFSGNHLEIILRNHNIGIAEVVAVRTFLFTGITDVLAYLDTGKPAHYLAELMRRMYSNKDGFNDSSKLDHVILHWKERNMRMHASFLEEWWREKQEEHPESIQSKLFE